MPERDRDRLEVAQSVARQLATEASLTPAQARSFVRGLQTSWDVPSIRWRQEEHRTQLDDARRLFQTAVMFQKVESYESPNAKNCYRRTGEILEWLMRTGDDLQTVVPLELFAAGAYQLGGLPAMAAALLWRNPTKTKGVELYVDSSPLILTVCWRALQTSGVRTWKSPIVRRRVG